MPYHIALLHKKCCLMVIGINKSIFYDCIMVVQLPVIYNAKHAYSIIKSYLENGKVISITFSS